jgi:hypothetical protein
MSRFGLALRTMVRIFRDTVFADQVGRLVAGARLPASVQEEREAGPRRSEALTLLEALQREARFVDFIMEPLDGYSDAQIGVAVRDVHRDCATVIRRFFDPQGLLEHQEGATVEVQKGFSPARYRLTGNVHGEAPYRGVLRHHGWTAGKCEVPLWTGDAQDLMVVAPAEVELP